MQDLHGFTALWEQLDCQVASEVYVWDDRAQHGMNAAFAFSLLLILILLAGRQFVPFFCEVSPELLDIVDPYLRCIYGDLMLR